MGLNMLRWPGFEGWNKGQFFVISVVIITTTLVGLVGLLGGYSEIRLTDVHSQRGEDIFNNVREELREIALESGCEHGPGDKHPRKRDLTEFIHVVESNVREEGMYLEVNLDEDELCDPPGGTTVNMSLYSQGLEVSEEFSLTPGAYFDLEITDYDDSVYEGQEVSVEYEVENTGDEAGEQDIDFEVRDDDNELVHSDSEEDVQLGSGESFGGEFTWDTEEGDQGNYQMTVSSEDDTDTVSVDVLSYEEYELTVNKVGEGTVEVDGEEFEDGETEDYLQGTELDVEAIDDVFGWQFDEWTGDVPDGEEGEEITVIMDEDREITAHFEEVDIYELEIDVDPEEGGTTDPEPGVHEYEEGEEVSIYADSDVGWEFEEWTGDCSGEDVFCSLDMYEDKSTTAHFVESECRELGEECGAGHPPCCDPYTCDLVTGECVYEPI